MTGVPPLNKVGLKNEEEEGVVGEDSIVGLDPYDARFGYPGEGF
jgi:hypothetical protein